MVLTHHHHQQQQQQHLSHLDRVGIVFQKYRVCAKVNKRRLFINGYTEKMCNWHTTKSCRRHQRNKY